MDNSAMHNQAQDETNVTEGNQASEKALAACEAQLADIKRNYALLNADFENFKKRLEKEQATVMFGMQKSLLVPLLDIVDNFDRALSDNAMTDKTMAAHLEGFSLIRKNLQKLLEKFGVKEITDNALFNPNFHEAVMSVEATEGKESGSIAAVLQKGYMLNSQVLRPAKVTIVS